jgi:hypothetical protein
VDDNAFCAKSPQLIDYYIANKLRAMNFELAKEESLAEYLVRGEAKGTIDMTEQGLIDKIRTTTSLQDWQVNASLLAEVPLGLETSLIVSPRTCRRATLP